MARDIRVRISGDSGDLVRAAAAAGIALEVLNKDTGKSSRAMAGLERSLGDTGRGAKDFGRMMDDATAASHRAGADILKTNHVIDDAGRMLENTAKDGGFFTTMLESITQAFTGGSGGGVIGALGTAVPLFGGLSAPLIALPAIIFAVVVAAEALTTILGSLVAVAADLVAPVSLVAGLLGSLGLGFVLAGKRAAQGGGTLGQFSDKLATLKSMFSKTTDILAHAFLPLLVQLATGAEQALLFIDKLAREPLDKAMHDMATKGVQMLNSFVHQVASVLAHPFRLAIKLAFGAGPAGNEVASMVSSWWNQFTGYLLGYTKTHQVHIGRFLGPMTTTEVQGALQPLLDWFNRHHFTRQGQEIADDILSGLKKISGPLSDYLSHVFLDAALKTGPYAGHLLAYGINHGLRDLDGYLLRLWNRFADEAKKAGAKAGREIVGAMVIAGSAIVKTLGNAWGDVKRDAVGMWHGIATVGRVEISAMGTVARSLLSSAWNAIKTAASSAWRSIKDFAGGVLRGIASNISAKLSSAWGAVKSAAVSAWNGIVAWIESHIPHISWSSIIGGAIPSLPFHIPGTATGGIVTGPQVRLVGEAGPEAIIPLNQASSHGIGGGPTININMPQGFMVGTAAQFENVVRQAVVGALRRNGPNAFVPTVGARLS